MDNVTYETTEEALKENDPLPKEGLIEEEEEEEKIEGNLMFDQKDISFCQLYCHISGPLEILLTIIAIIMTIAAGSSGAILVWIYGDSMDSMTLATEFEKIKEIIGEEVYNRICKYVMELLVEPEIDKKIKYYLIIGAIMFVCNFLMMFLWSYLAIRQIRWLKTNYFRIILNQEQGWFDSNNSFEFATKVQAQLEQIELGLGDRLG